MRQSAAVGSGWEEVIFPVAREGRPYLPTSLQTPSNIHIYFSCR